MKNTKVIIAGVEFKNPVMTASGLFAIILRFTDAI